jgi:cyclophilin family peptidyl-prolyl cis-trans isomerase
MARAERLPLAGLALAAIALAAGCGGGKKAASTTATTKNACPKVAAPAPRVPAKHRRPTALLAAGRTWTATVVTSCGTFAFRLDTEDSPQTAASFAALANGGYFDRTVFHRIVPGFVIQGGDPTQTGFGGPGYRTVERPPKTLRYTRGVVAMAKSESEPSGAAGSQFFVVSGDASFLPPDYALLGRVTTGMRVVRRIGRYGNGDAGVPTRPIVVERIRVRPS